MLCLSFELELLHTQVRLPCGTITVSHTTNPDVQSAAVLAIGWQQFTDNTMSPTRTQFSVDYWR